MSQTLDRSAQRHDIATLDHTVDAIITRLRGLADGGRLPELIAIWRRPGWTTPAEFRMVSLQLDGINERLIRLNASIDDLVEVAGTIGTTDEVTPTRS